MRISRFTLTCLLRAKVYGDLSCWGDFQLKPPNLVAVEQLQGLVQPLPTPPRPTEALAFPSAHHVAPNLLFHPVLNEAEALAGVPNRKKNSAKNNNPSHRNKKSQIIQHGWSLKSVAT